MQPPDRTLLQPSWREDIEKHLDTIKVCLAREKLSPKFKLIVTTLCASVRVFLNFFGSKLSAASMPPESLDEPKNLTNSTENLSSRTEKRRRRDKKGRRRHRR